MAVIELEKGFIRNDTSTVHQNVLPHEGPVRASRGEGGDEGNRWRRERGRPCDTLRILLHWKERRYRPLYDENSNAVVVRKKMQQTIFNEPLAGIESSPGHDPRRTVEPV
ncbi:hypothetical protein CDAR_243661 [Caerostris darwini]|uniref:Uncharacterized protein n=1 Tax=Caerostris darwini TaxID=1538125 RepID=A0AAV4VDH5_9ARAC|nr:hypothetical protein CDAR_243661 [Caerostris darwini]